MAGRRLAAWVVASMVAVSVGRASAARPADLDTTRFRAVRGEWALADELIATGTARSATIRDLVAELGRSDALVYVDVGFEASSAAGWTVLASGDGPRRILRVFINARLDSTRRLEILGHELAHCVEIADASSVRDAKTLRELERAIGWRSGSAEAFETAGARAAELRVHSELAAR
jgi:hypothetical protein